MKQILTILTFTLLLLTTSCHAQMMRTLNDAQKLKINEKEFIGQPLKTLLKEIKPEIKMVSANPSTSNQVRLGYFIFRFVDAQTYDSSLAKQKYLLQITVFVKEPFVWNKNNKSLNERFKWTKNDEKKYGQLTIVGIRVFGEN